MWSQALPLDLDATGTTTSMISTGTIPNTAGGGNGNKWRHLQLFGPTDYPFAFCSLDEWSEYLSDQSLEQSRLHPLIWIRCVSSNINVRRKSEQDHELKY